MTIHCQKSQLACGRIMTKIFCLLIGTRRNVASNSDEQQLESVKRLEHWND